MTTHLSTVNFCHFQKTGKAVLQVVREGLQQLDQYINEDFVRACEIIYHCRGKVIVMGIGKSGHIGKKIASTFASTGTPSFFIHPTEANHGDLGMVCSNDIVIAISNSGESLEILTLIPILKRRQILLICMTSRPNSRMAYAAEVHICVKVPQEACSLGLVPTSSSTATLVMGDALAIALLKAKKFTKEDFALSHPGGALGRKLLMRVDSIMRIGDSLPCLPPDASLHQALLKMTSKKIGAIVICHKNNIIQGIFTDGDLRRLLDVGTNINMHNIHISTVMTPVGIRISPDTLVVDAINIMKSKNITCIMIAQNNKLTGLVHIHDILRTNTI
ncbi:arabinose-5-phosphate isomerase KdsD [Candidatus Erwinia haradaeae]|uniref:Arabinose 5-phosphate isomerase n=1 Tax=Candidatus Erwinia haradaeae TaxID=1922217 RepID=A0A451D3Q9_9GAMM|nr:arabinose-5-phosphate isomerase KdsD [Candidatus Erwinia haradaeae]VFP80288.1 Arabinose 5-phosphate isomerase KdsD [Candidatus Erwinia haradaeae]